MTEVKPVYSPEGSERRMDEFTAEELYQAILQARDLEQKARRGRQLLEFEALQRMERRNAVKDQTPSFEASRVVTRTYTQTPKLFDELMGLMKEGQVEVSAIEDCYTIKTAWNQTRLNQLAKLGGKVKDAIEANSTVSKEDWKLDIKERKL